MFEECSQIWIKMELSIQDEHLSTVEDCASCPQESDLDGSGWRE